MKAQTIKRQRRDREIRTAKQGRADEAIGKLDRGCEIYILTFGQFSLIHALTAILEQTGPADVDISSWTAANAHLEQSERMMADSQIRNLRFVVDRSFKTRQPRYCQRMREIFGDGCIRTARSHAKFMAIRNDEWEIAVRTSMNLNENPRLENIEISDDPQLCGFLTSVVDSIFAEQDEGQFAGEIPVLSGVDNIPLDGRIVANRPTAGKIQGTLKPATVGPND